MLRVLVWGWTQAMCGVAAHSAATVNGGDWVGRVRNRGEGGGVLNGWQGVRGEARGLILTLNHDVAVRCHWWAESVLFTTWQCASRVSRVFHGARNTLRNSGKSRV